MDRRKCLQLLAGAAAAGVAMPLLGSDANTRADRVRFELWNRNRRFVETSFGKIAYCDAGNGPPALFLHGFPLNSFQWRSSIETLSHSHRCIAPDLLGMGFSRPHEGQDLSPDSQVQMLVELLDRLRADRVHLVSNDSGGAVAQLFAAKFPGRVRTLLFTNCDTELESPPAAMAPVISLAREGRYAETWLVPWLHDKKLARSPEGLGGMCYSDPTNPTDAALDMYLGPLVDGPKRLALTDRYALALGPNPLTGIGSKLKGTKLPARILWGTSDTIFSLAGAEHLDRSLGRSLGIRKIAGAKLFWPEERPDIIVEETRSLWSAFPA
jgi:pimeloyl-ACP methyl ester carboxylesterase